MNPPEVPTLHLIAPVYNEAANLPRLLGDLNRLREEIAGEFSLGVILVDDGSTDGTARLAVDLASSLRLSVVTHAVNQGPGTAFASGFAHVEQRLRPGDWVVTIEGDNTSRLATLRQMLQRRREGFEVVLASPYAYGGGMAGTPWHRVFISHVANGFVKGLLGVHGIHTMSSFFRLYDGAVLRRLYECYGPGIVERRGFECMVELLIKLIAVGATISEVPMRLDGSRRQGKSKMRLMRTTLGYLALFRHRRRWRQAAAAANPDLASASPTPAVVAPATQ